MMRKVELLVPASSLEVLKIAVVFGADAVYIGGEAFGLSDGLRKRADKIISLPMPGDMESLNAAVSLAVTLYTVEYALK